jgi:hypothetical protein
LISRFGMGMVQNQHQSIQDPQLFFCTTSKVEHINLVGSSRVGTILPTPPSIGKPIFHYALQSH